MAEEALTSRDSDTRLMSRALELARRGQGYVEPNPMVGCVIARDGEIIGEGWHQRFGGPHAEVEAIQNAATPVAGGTMYVTLEPCCHQGKTPPCTRAIIDSQIRRVVVAQQDPFPQVDGGGLKQLADQGIEISIGVLESQARELNAPYSMLIEQQRPWIIAKWAMTLDGKLATRTGDSRWISNESSRALVHQLRGRVDAVMIGSGTAHQDDPLLTARPPGPRTAARIVLDSNASIAMSSQLVATANEALVMIAAGPQAPQEKIEKLRDADCEVLALEQEDTQQRLKALMNELGRRKMTNVMVEGGGRLLGSLFDLDLVDEIDVYIAPKIAGGSEATRVGGKGIELMSRAKFIGSPDVSQLDGDVRVRGRIRRT